MSCPFQMVLSGPRTSTAQAHHALLAAACVDVRLHSEPDRALLTAAGADPDAAAEAVSRLGWSLLRFTVTDPCLILTLGQWSEN